MTLAGLKNGAILTGVMIGGGALIGGGIGAVRSLQDQPSVSANGFNSMEQRSVLSSVIIGAGAGALGGAALVGAKKLVTIPALRNVPLPAMMMLGIGTGAAAFGAYSLGRNTLN